MSADNGVYILTIGEDFGKPEKFCVFHATNIEELFSENEQWRRDYFDRHIKSAVSFVDRDEALLHAGRIARDLPVLEYGIAFLGAMRFPEEWWRDVTEEDAQQDDAIHTRREHEQSACEGISTDSLTPRMVRELVEAAQLVAEGSGVEVGTTPLRMRLLRKRLDSIKAE